MDEEQKLKELDEAGYSTYATNDNHASSDWQPVAEAPDGWTWEGHFRYVPKSESPENVAKEATEKAYERLLKERELKAFQETAAEIIKEADEFSLWLFGQLPENVESEGIQTIEIDIAKIVKLKKLFEPTE